MKIIPLEQRTPAWHEYRRGRVGASSSATIMGVNPFESKLQLWQRMKGLLPEKEQTEAMKTGVDLESEALQWYSDKVGRTYIPMVVQDDEVDYLFASLDGICMESRDIVEVKVSDWGYGQVQKGKVPPAYNAQIQHQLMVTGFNIGTLVCYNGLVGVSIVIMRDDEFIAKMRALEIEFYESLKGDEPPAEPKKRDFVDVEVDDELFQTVKNWQVANLESKRYDAIEKELRTVLIEQGDDGDFRLCKDGVPLVELTRNMRKGSLNTEKLYADFGITPEILQKYAGKEIGFYKLKPVQA